MSENRNIYNGRRLSDGYPDLGDLAHRQKLQSARGRPDHRPTLRKALTYYDRLIELRKGCSILVIGCGPEPVTIQFLLESGFDARGVEPVRSFVESAAVFLGERERVVEGSAEAIPFPDGSQQLVMMESVLEHVDSPGRSLAEICRVLAPGGILHVLTTNRLRFSLLGRNGEFNVPFYNWLPALVRECYVFDHLHYRPRLANFTQRPAVHWFTYAELCRLGREAGFAQFYSILDLVRREDPGIAGSLFRRTVLHAVQRRPWLRALALTQIGGSVIMWKRSAG